MASDLRASPTPVDFRLLGLRKRFYPSANQRELRNPPGAEILIGERLQRCRAQKHGIVDMGGFAGRGALVKAGHMEGSLPWQCAKRRAHTRSTECVDEHPSYWRFAPTLRIHIYPNGLRRSLRIATLDTGAFHKIVPDCCIISFRLRPTQRARLADAA